MKKTTWTKIFDIVDKNEPMTKEDYTEAIKWAEEEIQEYEDFIEMCKSKLVE